MRKSKGSRTSVFSVVSGIAMFTCIATVVGLGVLALAGNQANQEHGNSTVQESGADQQSESDADEQLTQTIQDDLDGDRSKEIATLKYTTANQVLKAIDSGEYLIFSELPDVEAQKVAKVLRERFPMESLRERMGEMPIAKPKPDDEKKEDAFRFHWGNRRGGALRQLHSAEVAKFIDSSGFGVMRSPPPSMNDLKFADEYATKIDRAKVGSVYLEGATIELEKSGQDTWSNGTLALSKNGVPKSEYMETLSQHGSGNFASDRSTGFVQDLDHVAGFNEHRFRMPKDWVGSIDHRKFFEHVDDSMPRWKDVDWKMNRIELVSLLMNNEPKVYVSENLPDMKELSSETAEKRELDTFELESLEKLKAGENLVTQSTLNRIIMLGAIRADTSCMECHDVQDKELLGAFSYEILRHPPVEPAADAKPF